MESNLKQKTISGMIWNAVGRFGTMAISFISNIVLARLLLPSDYGAVAMLNIFIAMSDILIVGGFSSALIQKKDAKPIDYNSVFYWNIVMSVVLYVVIYLSGPAISRFYNMTELTKILRVQSLSIVITALSAVQTNILTKELKFKVLTKRNIIASVCGTTGAIAMAFMGFGVWSLVASSLISGVVSVLLLWGMSDWRPTLEFSWSSIRELFAFGGLMMLSSIVTKLYSELQGLIIGKHYSASDLGYYNQAKALERIPVESLSNIVRQVTFPVYSKLQDNKELLLSAVRKNVIALTYLTIGMLALLIVIADPLIHLLYGDRWATSIPYFQILCIAGFVSPINGSNTNIIKSLGKSKLFFYIHLFYKSIGIIALVIGIRFGVTGILWSVVLISYLTFFVSTSVNKRLINYGLISQIKDVSGSFLCALVSSALAFLVGHYLTMNSILIMLIQCIVYLSSYLLISYTFHLEGFKIYMQIIKKK